MRAKREKSSKSPLAFAASIAFFILVLVGFSSGALYFSSKADSEGDKTLKNAIARSSVQCYAIEGRYPPSVEYLEEHYGIKIDRDRYNVFYEGFASNVMPDITVVPVEKKEK